MGGQRCIVRYWLVPAICVLTNASKDRERLPVNHAFVLGSASSSESKVVSAKVGISCRVINNAPAVVAVFSSSFIDAQSTSPSTLIGNQVDVPITKKRTV